MTLFLRNKRNQTVLDLELWEQQGMVDLSSVVVIDTYSEFLLENLERSAEVVADFKELSELRGWLFERFAYEKRRNFDEVLAALKSILTTVAKKYGLIFEID